MTINRPGGLLLSWETFHPFVDRPSYVEVAALPLAQRMAALRDPGRRERILKEPVQTPMLEHAATIVMSSLGSTFPPNTECLAEPDPANSLARRIERTGATPLEGLYDALCDAAEQPSGPGFLNVFMGNYAEGSLDAVHEMLSHPATLVGGGDGGAHVTVICDASYPTYMLQHWVRERTRGPRIPVEQAVRMLTRDPARTARHEGPRLGRQGPAGGPERDRPSTASALAPRVWSMICQAAPHGCCKRPAAMWRR